MKNLIILLSIILLTGCLVKKEIPKNIIQSDSTLVSIVDTNNYNDNKIIIDTDNYKEHDKVLSSNPDPAPSPKIEEINNSKSTIKIKHIKNSNVIKKETPEISLGNVIYQTPDTMVVLIESKVIVRISKGKLNTEQITENLSGSIKVVPINVTSKMEVKLVDPSPESSPSFEIKSVNKYEQVIEDEVYTEWDFTVIPLKAGEHELKLVVSIIRGDEVKEQTWSDTIKVKNNVPKKVLGFWEKYWQWLLTTIFIPLVVYFWKKRDDKKKNS